MKLLIITIIVCLACAKNIFLEQEPIINIINNLKTTWKAGHNKYFDGKTISEIKSLMGALETPDELKLPEIEIEPLSDIPENFDSATNWPGCESLKEVRDQSTCGSC